MIRRFLFLFMLIGLLHLVNCTPLPAKPAGLWFYTYSEQGSATDSTLTPISFLNLQPNGTFTCDFKAFDYGAWKMSNGNIYLINFKYESVTLKVATLSATTMQLSFAGVSNANFERQPVSFKSISENPFAKENNLWRIKARAKENDEEIKLRLLNHFKFWEIYFKWALNEDLQTIDVRSTPTLLKIYGNGFALKSLDQLPARWKSYFFDEDDCRKANSIIKDFFDHHDISWAHTQNKYTLFISAFQQLQQGLK